MGYVLTMLFLMVLAFSILSAVPKWRDLKKNSQWWIAFVVSATAITNCSMLIIWLTLFKNEMLENKSLIMFGILGVGFLVYAIYLWMRFGKSHISE